MSSHQDGLENRENHHASRPIMEAGSPMRDSAATAAIATANSTGSGGAATQPLSLLFSPSSAVGGTVDNNNKIENDETYQPRKNRGGRPKGTTGIKKGSKPKQLPPPPKDHVLEEAIEWTASMLVDAKKEVAATKKSGGRVAKGKLASLIIEAREKFNLREDQKISEGTIKSRVKRGNLKGKDGTIWFHTPMKEVEPFLVATVVQLIRFDKALNKNEFLQLAHSVIKGTPTEQKVIRWKKKCKIYDAEAPLLGNGFYKNFMKRNGDEIQRRTRKLENGDFVPDECK